MATVRKRTHFLLPILALFTDAMKRAWSGGAAGGVVSGSSANTTATNNSVTFGGHVRYTNVPAPDTTSIVADVAVANGAQTIAAQPTHPVRLRIAITDGDSSISAGTATVAGKNANGQTVQQVINLAGGTREVVTDEAYATVTSITVASLAGNTGADHISVGQSGALGVPWAIGGASFACHKVNVDDAADGAPTVVAAYGVVTPATAPNGTRDFDLWYSYAVQATQAAHNHAAGTFTTAPASSAVHFDRGEYTCTTANASNLATSMTLAKALITLWNKHRLDELAHGTGSAQGTDTTNTVASAVADVVDLPTTVTAANQLKAAYNAHRTRASTHAANDTTNVVTAADATDQSSVNTLLNDIKTQFNAHIADGMLPASIRLED